MWPHTQRELPKLYLASRVSISVQKLNQWTHQHMHKLGNKLRGKPYIIIIISCPWYMWFYLLPAQPQGGPPTTQLMEGI